MNVCENAVYILILFIYKHVLLKSSISSKDAGNCLILLLFVAFGKLREAKGSRENRDVYNNDHRRSTEALYNPAATFRIQSLGNAAAASHRPFRSTEPNSITHRCRRRRHMRCSRLINRSTSTVAYDCPAEN